MLEQELVALKVVLLKDCAVAVRTGVADKSELWLEQELEIFAVVLPTGCDSEDDIGAELMIAGVCPGVNTLEIIVSLMSLILCQEPELSPYLYCCAGFAFQILTLLTNIEYGSGTGNGVTPPAHCIVPGFP